MHAQRCALEAHPPPARIVTPRASARARADRGMRQHAGPAERCEGRHTSGSCLPIESCVSSFEQLSVPATQPDALRQQRPPWRALLLQLPGRCDLTLPLRAPRVRCLDPAASPFTKPTTWPSSSRTMKYGPASFMLACSHARRHATLSVQRRHTPRRSQQRRSGAATQHARHPRRRPHGNSLGRRGLVRRVRRGLDRADLRIVLLRRGDEHFPRFVKQFVNAENRACLFTMVQVEGARRAGETPGEAGGGGC